MPEPTHRYAPLPADGHSARWSTWAGDHDEQLTIRWENEAWTAVGRVASADVEYVLRVSPLWQVRQFLLFRDLPEPDLWLGTDGRGRWGEMNGAHRPEFDGAVDLGLAVTPFVHAVPIRRLELEVGDSASVPVLVVDVETLALTVVTHTYVRREAHRWSVAADGEEHDFEVDVHGLPGDVPGRFRRIA